MSELTRRELLTAAGAAVVAAATAGCASDDAPPASSASSGSPADAASASDRFFTPHELATVTVLADMIIPRDERSGSASDAGVPAFLDYALREVEGEDSRLAVRGGLAWLDAECRRRWQRDFVGCSPADRGALLDEIAWPARAKPELGHGVAFFTRMRDLVAGAFFSSRIGVEDLRYQGNVIRTEWQGCPPAALAKLGVSYDAPAAAPRAARLPVLDSTA